ncbi:MAG: DegT/DnrJ/EryC1/StrS family aminotransferase, partial [Deltaproteobacteria bacterium]|nr:DegT/DnrJ/EryC1/StrS family aminotransferase [Deltaproteobacteria bacterium]
IELDTYGLDASKIEEKISPRTKAIILHHLYGIVCRDYSAILEIAHKHHLRVIEDCAQATGAIFKDRKVGNLGDLAFYSSEQSKVFCTVVGGLATTNDHTLGQRLQEFYRSAPYPGEDRIEQILQNVIINYYSYRSKYRWITRDLVSMSKGDRVLISTTREEEHGGKPVDHGCRLPPPLAALGLNQLAKLDKKNDMRRAKAREWDEWCENNGYKKPLIIAGSRPIYLRYPVMVEKEKKSDLRWAYMELGIIPGVWFISNVHPSDMIVRGCPNADLAVERCINLPTLE